VKKRKREKRQNTRSKDKTYENEAKIVGNCQRPAKKLRVLRHC
jgi:hypothetical protein